MSENRDVEKMRYEEAYKSPKYRMGLARIAWGASKLRLMEPNTTVLDVGAGRGELIVCAIALGLKKAWGVDAAPSLAWGQEPYKVITADAWKLPFGEGVWDVVFCMDMLEHILEADVDQVLAEVFRVAKRNVFLTASNIDSVYKGLGQLHVTQLEYKEWDRRIYAAAAASPRRWSIVRDGRIGVAEAWSCSAVV